MAANKWLYVGGAVAVCAALAPMIALYISVIILGVALAFNFALCRGKTHQPPSVQQPGQLANALLRNMMEMSQKPRKDVNSVVLSGNLDVAVDEVIQLFTRDYIASWCSDITTDTQGIVKGVQGDTWELLGNLRDRLVEVDMVQLLAHDVVKKLCSHFEAINRAVKYGEPVLLSPWLKNEETEREMLRKMADTLLLALLPQRHTSLPRHLLREIITASVLVPCVELLCDPAYINDKMAAYFERVHVASAEHKRTYAYAASYEDFMTMIETCMDVKHLQPMRYSIIAEIMQATTINNLKKAQGIDLEKEISPKGTTKGDLLKARNLKRYINQLTVSKSNCEKRITMLGGPDYSTAAHDDSAHTNIPGKKVLSFYLIMNNDAARGHFMKYLQKDDNHSLLGFWVAVGRLKTTEGQFQHQMASEIYHMYIVSNTSAVKANLHRATIKGMEAFLIGDQGPESFYTAQGEIFAILEEQHYHSFIVSDIYHQYMELRDADTWSVDSTEDDRVMSPGFEHIEQPSDFIADQSLYAQQKLSRLDEKLTNKTQALSALRNSPKPDSKIMKLQGDIEDEIESLRADKRQLEFHIQRTEDWSSHIGNWRASIFNTEVMGEDGEKLVPYFVIIINTSETMTAVDGWVISRTLEDFHALHTQLKQICPWLRKKELPKMRSWSKSVEATFIDKAKLSLDDYLKTMLKDDRLCQSEAVYAFFSPSPQHLKQAAEPDKTHRSLIPNIFKRMSSQNAAGDRDLLFLEEDGVKEDESKDSIAGPLYLLIGELFRLKGVFKWLRRTLIMFVQVSFGKSINRQLREMTDWVFSEAMLIYYIHLVRDAFWPDGKLYTPQDEATDAEKMQRRMHAKDLLLENIPDTLKNLVGENNARRGAIRVFEAVQDKRLNKQLFYMVLEVFMYELCPELKQHKGGQPKPSNSSYRPSEHAEKPDLSPTPSEQTLQTDKLFIKQKNVIPFYRF